MKVLFKNTTKYNKENCNNFEEFHFRKYGTKELIKLVLFLLVMLYIIIYNLFYKNWLFFSIALLVLAIVYAVKKYEAKGSKKKEIKKYVFCFYENYMKVKYKKQEDRVLYLQFKKIFETKDNFFLYTDDTHSMILDKKGFGVGTPEGFAQFIKKKCPLKYRKEK